MGCKPCNQKQTITDEINSSNYRIELYLDSKENANLIFHTIGEDFKETEEALNKFILKIQEQIINKKRCPFFIE